MEDTALPVASAIIERGTGGEKKILLQERVADYDKVYKGCLEIPAGRIGPYENIFDALEREVLEETGLTVTSIAPDTLRESSNAKGSATVFQPFCCQQLMEGNIPWIGFVFLCRAKGETERTDEAEGHRWVNMEDLRGILEKERDSIFSLHLPVLEYYLEENN